MFLRGQATTLRVTNPRWPGSVVDPVGVISYSNRAASLANDAQLLLYGDSDSFPYPAFQCSEGKGS
jgi:hypothetical protein